MILIACSVEHIYTVDWLFNTKINISICKNARFWKEILLCSLEDKIHSAHCQIKELLKSVCVCVCRGSPNRPSAMTSTPLIKTSYVLFVYFGCYSYSKRFSDALKMKVDESYKVVNGILCRLLLAVYAHIDVIEQCYVIIYELSSRTKIEFVLYDSS